MGGQFVVRTFDPPPPPVATTAKLSYVRGGGMLLRGTFGADQAGPACSLLIDTGLTYPVALDGKGWKKAGIEVASLKAVPGAAELRQGILPLLRIGAFELPHVPGLDGESAVKEREDNLGVEIDGLIGSGLFASFRVTLVDGGRTMWLEDLPQEAMRTPQPLPVPDVPDEAYDEAAPEEETPAPPAKTPAGKAPVTPAPARAPAPVPAPATKAPTVGQNAPAPAPAPKKAAP
jgi:hypothetical protein